MTYNEFLQGKRISMECSGFDITESDINPQLFDFQRDIVRWAVKKGKSAVFAGTGLGKTLMQLEWARHVHNRDNKQVLILAPLAVASQTVKEGAKFGIDVTLCRSQEDVRTGINITNYDMLHKFDPSSFDGIVLDESSILKSFTGKVRNQIIESFANTQYKLACTATPAPNDHMELGNHAEFLGVMNRSEMLAMFFVHDGGNTSQWRLKGHSVSAFWQWVSSWAVMLTNPSDLGYENNGFDLLPLSVNPVVVDKTGYRVKEAQTLTERRDARRNSLDKRVAAAVDLVADSHENWIIWCDLNSESEAITKAIDGAVEITGSHDREYKTKTMTAFANGEIDILVTKAKIAGFGMNFQVCHNMAFVGLSDCYDSETEILTQDGWKTFDLVTMDDKIATVNQETLMFEWEQPIRVVWESYEGDMYHFVGQRNFDLMVTPNHKLFVSKDANRYPTSDGSWNLEYAQDIVDGYKKMNRRMLSVSNGFYNQVPTDVIKIPIPSGMRISSRSRIVEEVSIKDMVELAGWYVSEGHCRPLNSKEAGRIVISQTDLNPKNRIDIINLLKRIGLHVNHKTKDITGYSYNLAAFLIDEFGSGSYNKHLPKWIKNLDSKWLEILRDTMIKGDGCHNNGIPRVYRTVSRELADDFQELCLKTGVRASIRKRYGVNKDYPNNHIYDVSLAWSRTKPYIHTKPEKVHYNGFIGCVEVPNHTVIVRRNGIPVVSGNSFEAYYQAVRRCWRFGQKEPVNVHVITSEAEGAVVKNINRKEADFKVMQRGMISATQEITKQNLSETKREVSEYMTSEAKGQNWTMYLEDNIERTRVMEDESVDFIMYSPPFSSLYTYSDSDRDMGNCKTDDEFFKHFGFLAPELFRALKSGRLMSVHCMNIPTTLTKDGYIGIKDFRGDIIRLMQSAGFIYHSEVCIWKDPVVAMQRTHAKGLLHKHLKKDSCVSRMGLPDYVVTFLKPGINQEPVEHTGADFPVDLWQKYASPIWDDIRQGDTLQRTSARDERDERHICPLQFDVIQRCIELWTNPDDLVYDPFAGIGSTLYQAVLMGRRGVGCELKQSYFDQAIKNLMNADRKASAPKQVGFGYFEDVK